jgi:hypothetical protein
MATGVNGLYSDLRFCDGLLRLDVAQFRSSTLFRFLILCEGLRKGCAFMKNVEKTFCPSSGFRTLQRLSADRLAKAGRVHVGGWLAFAASCAVLAAPVFGNPISSVERDASGTADTIGDPGNGDPAAVITYIASIPNATAVDGYTYTNWAFLANDGTGSLDIFGKIPAATPYTPTVGDAVTVSGTYAPFDAIPEIDALTSIVKQSGGNAVAGPISTTIPQINAIASASNFSISEYLLTLSDVTFVSPPANFPTHADLSLTASDGTNSLTVFYDPSSYSVSGPWGGTPIPTGPVTITGIADVFSGASEFIPLSIVSVPEPTTMSLLALGGMALLGRRRRSAN